MMKYGFIKVASAVPMVKVGDVKYNVEQIENLTVQAEGKGVEVIVFPELSVTGYSCQDLFSQNLLLEVAEQGVMMLLDFTRKLDIITIVGAPVVAGDLLLNCAVVIQQGQILGIVPKTYLPNYSEFYEKRWFASAQDLLETEIRFAGHTVKVTPDLQLFRTFDGVRFGVEICEDVWAPAPPSNKLGAGRCRPDIQPLSLGRADRQAQLSEESAVAAECPHHDKVMYTVRAASARVHRMWCMAVMPLSTRMDKCLKKGERFATVSQMVTAQIDVERLRSERRTNSTYVNAQRNIKYSILDHQFGIRNIEASPAENDREFVLERPVNPSSLHSYLCRHEGIVRGDIQYPVMGLAKRIVHTGAKTVVVGISGGLDSTLALLVLREDFRQVGYEPQGNRRSHHAWFRNHRPHLQQCHHADAELRHHHSRDQHRQGRDPAFLRT